MTLPWASTRRPMCPRRSLRAWLPRVTLRHCPSSGAFACLDSSSTFAPCTRCWLAIRPTSRGSSSSYHLLPCHCWAWMRVLTNMMLLRGCFSAQALHTGWIYIRLLPCDDFRSTNRLLPCDKSASTNGLRLAWCAGARCKESLQTIFICYSGCCHRTAGLLYPLQCTRA